MEEYNNEFVEDIKKLLTDANDNTENIKSFINKIFYADIYIYGAGNMGRMTYKLLQEMNIDVKGFMDTDVNKCNSYINKPVFRAADENIKDNIENTFIIIAFICSYEDLENMKSKLFKLGYKNVCYFHDIYSLISLTNLNSNELKSDHTIFNSQNEKIFKVASYLCDDKSREIYYNFFNAMINSNPDLFSKPEKGEAQYFVNDIIFSKGYSRFIDCGAFDGDTAIELKKYKGQIEKIALFEPETENFKKMSKNLNEERVADEEILFPCGVWKESEMLRFKSGIESSSMISEQGDVFVQCVSIDDALRDFAPTFIKMDIEGTEQEALLGAENTIRRYTPDLAISVYHKVEDMWEIPLFIKSLNENYKFYLRCHASHGMETILYAVCVE